MKKNIEKNKYYKFGLYLVVLLLINIVSITLYFRIDLTSNSLYSLSDASVNAVGSLKEPLTINVFFSKNLPSPYNNVERYLHDLLEEYEIKSNKFLNYRFYDVMAKEGDLSEDAEENRKIAHSYGIYPVNVQKIEQDEAKIQKAYMGMVFIHGDIIEKLPAVISTENLEYKITTTIRKMNNKISALINLPEKIKVILVKSSSLQKISKVINLKGLESLNEKIKIIVDNLNRKTYGQLEFINIDPAINSSFNNITSKFERFMLQWPEVKLPSGELIEKGSGIVAIGMEYKGESVQKRLLSKKLGLTSQGLQEEYFIIEDKEIENFINENIDNMININQDIGYLTSNGTLSLKSDVPPQMQMIQQQRQSDLSNFNTLVGSEYNVKEIDLKKEEIPESIDTLIIAGPRENFSDWDLFQIDQFLMKGKSIAFLIDSFNEIQQNNRQQMYGYQQPVYLPVNTGLEKLMGHYGFTINKSYLLDENCYINRDRNNNEMPIYFAPILKNENINHSFDFMENIRQLIAIKISPVEIKEKILKENNINSEKLFSSSDKSWEMKGKINLMPMMIKPPESDKEKKNFPLAYLLEGKFNSYFSDKNVPEKPEKEEGNKDDKNDKEKIEKKDILRSEVKKSDELIRSGKPGKIFIIGSSELIKNNVLDEEGNSPNALFLLNILDYLNNREDIAVMRGKKQRFNPVDDTKPFTRTFVKLLNIGGLPLGFIIFGVFVWLGRNKRRKKIRLLFKDNIKE
ncbi:MAG: Gldg family protein [Acidobacteriota bacterium]